MNEKMQSQAETFATEMREIRSVFEEMARLGNNGQTSEDASDEQSEEERSSE